MLEGTLEVVGVVGSVERVVDALDVVVDDDVVEVVVETDVVGDVVVSAVVSEAGSAAPPAIKAATEAVATIPQRRLVGSDAVLSCLLHRSHHAPGAMKARPIRIPASTSPATKEPSKKMMPMAMPAQARTVLMTDGRRFIFPALPRCVFPVRWVGFSCDRTADARL